MILGEERQHDSAGKVRVFLLLKCDYCDTEFSRQKSLYKSEHHGCTRLCISFLKETKVKLKCSHCSSEIIKKRANLANSIHSKYFCDRECKEAGQRYIKEIQPDHYGTGEANYRERALKEYGAKCNRCDYSENIAAIVVHHINHNRKDNSLGNLEVLCANCHAIEHWGI